jgi:nucleoside 2-deoxyribosyltransferase
MKTVYLAGPVCGCDKGEANDWRNYVRRQIAPASIQGISPLRCEPLRGARYEIGYDTDPKFGTARAIAAKNFFDVQHTDMTLAYLPRFIVERRPSFGTIGELAWAFALRKPTILVSDTPAMIEHPVIQACAGWVLATLDEGIEVILGILTDYASMSWRSK